MHPSYHKTRLKLHRFVSLTGSLTVRVRLGGKGCQKDTQTGWPWEALETLFTLRKCHSATVPPRVAMKFTFCGHNSKVATSNVTWLKNENNSTSCTKLILLVLDNPYYKQNMWLIFFRQHKPFRTFCPLTTILYFDYADYGTGFSYPKALTVMKAGFVAISRKQHQEMAGIRK